MGEPNVFHFALAQLIATEWGVNPSTGSLLMAAEIIQRETAPICEQHAEMLAALKDLLRCPDIDDIDPEDRDPETEQAIKVARALVTKAKGRE